MATGGRCGAWANPLTRYLDRRKTIIKYGMNHGHL